MATTRTKTGSNPRPTNKRRPSPTGRKVASSGRAVSELDVYSTMSILGRDSVPDPCFTLSDDFLVLLKQARGDRKSIHLPLPEYYTRKETLLTEHRIPASTQINHISVRTPEWHRHLLPAANEYFIDVDGSSDDKHRIVQDSPSSILKLLPGASLMKRQRERTHPVDLAGCLLQIASDGTVHSTVSTDGTGFDAKLPTVHTLIREIDDIKHLSALIYRGLALHEAPSQVMVHIRQQAKASVDLIESTIESVARQAPLARNGSPVIVYFIAPENIGALLHLISINDAFYCCHDRDVPLAMAMTHTFGCQPLNYAMPKKGTHESNSRLKGEYALRTAIAGWLASPLARQHRAR